MQQQQGNEDQRKHPICPTQCSYPNGNLLTSWRLMMPPASSPQLRGHHAPCLAKLVCGFTIGFMVSGSRQILQWFIIYNYIYVKNNTYTYYIYIYIYTYQIIYIYVSIIIYIYKNQLVLLGGRSLSKSLATVRDPLWPAHGAARAGPPTGNGLQVRAFSRISFLYVHKIHQQQNISIYIQI